MKEKALTLLTLIFIATSITGFTYAHWGDAINISGIVETGGQNMGFVEPLNCTEYHRHPVTGELVQGEYLGKDIGKCECNYTDYKIGDTGSAYNTTVITITNAYPGYEVHCNFTLENIGTIPLHINSTIISDLTGELTWNSTLSALVDDDNKPIINITTPALVCNYLYPWDDPLTPETEPKTLEAEIVIYITQNAKECHTYSFHIEIYYVSV